MLFRQRSANGMIRQLGFLFILIGTVFAVVSLAGVFSQFRQKESRIETVATITEVGKHRTEVAYVVDGEYYTVSLNYHSSMKFPGDTLVILYDPDHPEDAVYHMPWFYAVFMGPGALMFCVGAGMLFWSSFRRKKIRWLRENGQYIYAEIIKVEKNWRFRYNRRYARNLICQYSEPDGTVRIFKSDPFFGDNSRQLLGMRVTVYRERGNEGNYYVDIESVT